MRRLLTSFSWGESAGSVSVSLQMLANGGDTEGLFRAAFMQSGSPTPTVDITRVGIFTAISLNSEWSYRVNNVMTTSLNALVARALLTP